MGFQEAPFNHLVFVKKSDLIPCERRKKTAVFFSLNSSPVLAVAHLRVLALGGKVLGTVLILFTQQH